MSILNNRKFRKILILCCSFISLINKCFGKKRNRIIFYGSRFGMFSDNSRAVFEYLILNKFNEKYEILIVVPCAKKFKCLEKHKNVRVVGRLCGVCYFILTKYVFYSYGSMFIKPARSQIVVNLWHGTPLKKIEHLLKDDISVIEDRDYFTYILASSKRFVDVMAMAFGCDKSKVLILGHPRNDLLFSSGFMLEKLNIPTYKFKKYILWMPTFRVSDNNRFQDGISTESGLPLLSTWGDLELLNDYLVQQQVLLVIKLHPLAVKTNYSFTNIVSITDSQLDEANVQLYGFVKDFDALLTDYSSIFCDYLLLDRPIGFTLDDYEIYENKRGFIFDNITDYMPGHHIYNQDDVYKYIDDIVNDRDKYKEQRKAALPFFCKYADGNNCRRLVEEVGIKQ